MAIGDFSAELKDLLFRETDLPQRVEGFDTLMKEALSAAEVLAPLIEEFVGRHALANVPAPFQPSVRMEVRRLTYAGFITHCLLFSSPYRSRAPELDRTQLSSEWVVRSVTCLSTMTSYSKDNAGYPERIFRVLYAQTLEPLQRQLRLGWWRRFRNEPKFRHFFASGLVLGLLADMQAKELSDKRNGP